MTVSRTLIGQRLHQTATSWNEICRLLNTWIPFTEADQIDFTPYPLSALLAVSRKLDLPLSTLIPELQTLPDRETPATATGNTATPTARAGQRDRHHGDRDRPALGAGADGDAELDLAPFDVADSGTDTGGTGTGTGPERDAATWASSPPDQRGMLVLTALAHAGCPMDATDIAQALDVPLAESAEALQHLLGHPQLAGPMRLRPVPPDLYELKPRVDLLTADQLLVLKSMDVARDGMTATEATLLRAALDIRYHFSVTSIRDYAIVNPDVADRLVRLGYLQPPGLTDEYVIDPDVINSLRLPLGQEMEFERFRSPHRSDPVDGERHESTAAKRFPLRPAGTEPVSSRARPPETESSATKPGSSHRDLPEEGPPS